jgi:endoglucanase
MAKLTGEDQYKQQATQFCDWVVDQAPKTPKGLVHLDQWGALRHVSNVAFVCMQVNTINKLFVFPSGGNGL